MALRHFLAKSVAQASDAELASILSARHQWAREAISRATLELAGRGVNGLLAWPEFYALSTYPYACPNCDAAFSDTHLFCSGLCEDEASFVRYYRACLEDGRANRPDVEAELAMRLARLVSGYSDRDRIVSQRLRAAVVARDRGLCRLCSMPGDEVDHINGNAADLDNLQFLCVSCHRGKTARGFVPIPRSGLAAELKKRAPLLCRVTARYPERLSDDPAIWRHISRKITSARKRYITVRRLRRCGTKCPVCLATLLRNTRAEYATTGEKRKRSCRECLAIRTRNIYCMQCGAEAVWLNAAMATCQACAAHGTVAEIARRLT